MRRQEGRDDLSPLASFVRRPGVSELGTQIWGASPSKQ